MKQMTKKQKDAVARIYPKDRVRVTEGELEKIANDLRKDEEDGTKSN